MRSSVTNPVKAFALIALGLAIAAMAFLIQAVTVAGRGGPPRPVRNWSSVSLTVVGKAVAIGEGAGVPVAAGDTAAVDRTVGDVEIPAIADASWLEAAELLPTPR